MRQAFILFILFTSALAAQNAVPPAATPAFLLAAGASYNSANTPRVAGWLSGAFEMTPGLYSITTLDETLKQASIRTGVAKILYAKGSWYLLGHADGGVTTTGGAAVGSFSGGAMVAYRLLKTENFYAIGVMRLVAVTSVTVRPVYEFGFGYGF